MRPIKLFLAVLIICSRGLFAAISANTVLEVRTTGADTNGGGFVTGAAGTDWSQNDNKNAAGCTSCGSSTADLSTTDAVAVGTTTITSITATFGTTIVGNIVYFTGGTGSIAAQWRQVTARASATSITIDASIAASTGMTMNIGGALASPGQAAGIAISGNTVWIKSGTYTVSSGSSNVSNGVVAIANQTANTNSIWQGYGSARADLGTAPIMQVIGNGTVTSVTVFALPAGGSGATLVANIVVDGQLQTAIKGFSSISSKNLAYMIGAKNCTNTGILFSLGRVNNSFVTGCTTTGPAFQGVEILGSQSYSNTVSGFGCSNIGCSISFSLSYLNTGASSSGFTTNGQLSGGFFSDVAYANGSHGFLDDQSAGVSASAFVNDIAEGNTGVGFNALGLNTILLANYGTFNNTGGAKSTNIIGIVSGAQTASSSFFVNAAGGNFALNNTASAGALARGTGYPGVFPSGTTTGFLDIGAAQHQCTGGGCAIGFVQ